MPSTHGPIVGPTPGGAQHHSGGEAMIVVNSGPWRIRDSIIDGNVAVSYRADGHSQIVATETREDLALLRDAIAEYLERTAPIPGSEIPEP